MLLLCSNDFAPLTNSLLNEEVVYGVVGDTYPRNPAFVHSLISLELRKPPNLKTVLPPSSKHSQTNERQYPFVLLTQK